MGTSPCDSSGSDSLAFANSVCGDFMEFNLLLLTRLDYYIEADLHSSSHAIDKYSIVYSIVENT